MGVLIIIVAALWFFLGHPAKNVADLFWPSAAAPWEKVDAFYYPDRADLTEHRKILGLTSITECRGAVHDMAAELGDRSLSRGDYECGIGQLSSEYGLSIYRITAK